ncbi:MAG: pseudouridine synthase [Nitrospirota bacterium]
MEMRLQKAIADAGVASRRAAEEMIRTGRVTVNGRTVCEMGVKVDPEKDHVKVDGRHLKPAAPKAYVILNKPKDVLTTLEGPEKEDRLTIRHCLRGVRHRVFPVGRLDYDTEGLLLLTNDGELAERLLHPRYHVQKTYLTKIKGTLQSQEFRHLETGIELKDGLTAPAQVKKIRKAEENSWIELTIYEGRTHQVKRMLEAVGHPVLKLKRVRFGPLTLGNLPLGEYRFLTDPEIHRLKAAARAAPSSGKGRPRAQEVVSATSGVGGCKGGSERTPGANSAHLVLQGKGYKRIAS